MCWSVGVGYGSPASNRAISLVISRGSLISRAVVVAVIALGITLLFSSLSLFSFLELKGLDLLFALRNVQPVQEPIVIVAIDEPSMAEIGRQWPWPRSLHARLIQQLEKAGAKVIGLDILFAEPSDPAEDAALEDTLRANRNVVLVNTLVMVNDPLFRHTMRVDPIPAFRNVATVGSPRIRVDGDGVVRRAYLLSPDMPSFALQVVRRYLGNPTPGAREAAQVEWFKQRDWSREVLIDYVGPPKTIKTVSYYQALNYEQMLPPGTFAGKIVLVGRLLEAIPELQSLPGDTFFTPFSWQARSPSAGVEIQANLISNVLEGRFMAELEQPWRWILLLGLLLASSLLIVYLKPITALIVTIALVGSLLVAAYGAFTQMGLWFPILSSLLGLVLVFGGHLLMQALLAERERRQWLEKANRELEIEVAERTYQLSTAHEELQHRHQQIEAAYQELARAKNQLVHSEKMASLGFLVAGVAHELNNPISFIYNNLDFIEEYAEDLVGIVEVYANNHQSGKPNQNDGHRLKEQIQIDKTMEGLRGLITSCKNGADRIKEIVLDLRVFSRTDDVGLVLADLHEGIDSTLKMLTKQYENRITIHRDYGYLPPVECYLGQINQVFMNVLQNAAQAIQKQGDVWIETKLSGDWVKIAIKDNGIGIADDDIGRIFDPFFTRKKQGLGMGLGLSISYGIIQKHNGTIRVTSRLGEGTEFTIELPVGQVRKNHGKT